MFHFFSMIIDCFRCHFKSNKASSATNIYVQNEYFYQDFTYLGNYVQQNFTIVGFDKQSLPIATNEPVTFTFRIPGGNNMPSEVYIDLQNLDISIIKIDKSITQNSVTDTGFKILKNLIQTSKDIGFKTLCEGIETKEQEKAAIEAGCDLLQGFYYYKPMSVATFESLFDNTSGGN